MKITITINDKNACRYSDIFHAAQRDLLSMEREDCEADYYKSMQKAGMKAEKIRDKIDKVFNLKRG